MPSRQTASGHKCALAIGRNSCIIGIDKAGTARPGFEGERKESMTFRSVFLGLLGAALISSVCYFNDGIIRQGMLVSHLMPVVVYGGLVLFLLILNPVLRRLRASWSFSGKELAVIVALVLVACSIPSWGLVQCLPTSIMLPHHFARQRSAWREQEVLKKAPSQMMPDISGEKGRALTDYISGMAKGDEHIGFSDVPWHAWTRTLAFWVPLMLCIVAATLGLALVFHRQWVHHEQLPYPISKFAHALLPGGGEARGAVFRSGLFWVGAGVVFAIHMNNYACKWWPDVFVTVPLSLDFTALATLFPTLVRGGDLFLFRPTILFAVVGLAYFIASDVSFSMAVVPFIFCCILGVFAGYGVSLRTGDHMSVKIEAFLFTGGYFGILLMLAYTGRHYYWHVLRRSVSLRASGDDVGEHAVWGMRVFILGTLFFIVQLVVVGLDWQLAVLYTGIALMIYIVVSRTIAETGAFHIGTEIFPGAILIGFMGASALGLEAIIIMYLVSAVVLVAPGWSPMPFIVQALKLGDMADVKVARAGKWAAVALVLCVAIAVPVTIYWQYDQGAPQAGWPHMAAGFPFENLTKMKLQLLAHGTLEQSESLHGWARFSHTTLNAPCVSAFFIALVVCLGMGACRLRFARWPFHPVVFVFLGGWQAKLMAGSFMLGWVIKTLVSKYGGARLYQRLKPLMIGVIAGDMLARLIPMLVGAIYYTVTGQKP